MSSGDENYEPGRPRNRKRSKKTISEIKPLVPQATTNSDESPSPAVAGSSKDAKPPARRKSYLEQKYERNFKKSGMKAGALLNYFVKKPDPEETPSTITAVPVVETDNITDSNRMESESFNSPSLLEDVDALDQVEVCSSQDSDIIFVGEVKKRNDVEEIVDLSSTHSESGDAGVAIVGENNEEQANSPEVDENVLLQDSDSSDGEDFVRARNALQQSLSEDSDLDSDPQLPVTPYDVVQNWNLMNKRHLEEDEQSAEGDEMAPRPPKAPRFNEEEDESNQEQRENDIQIPEGPSSTTTFSDEDEQMGENEFHLTNASQNERTFHLVTNDSQGLMTPPQDSSSPLPIKIVSVVGGVGANLPGTSAGARGSQSDQISSSQEKVKKSIFTFKEKDNSTVKELVKKKKWKEAALKMKEDMDKNYHLPLQTYVSELIRNAILCETRVSKEVQKESMEFLAYLTKEYTAHGDKQNRDFIDYYIGVFSEIYADNDETTGNRLNHFFVKIVNRVSDDSKNKSNSNALWLLNIITKLVECQYQEYERLDSKLKPSLLQYFLETKEGQVLKYECCRPIVENLFEATTYDELFLYLKWVDLLAKRFGYSLFKKEYSALVEGVASYCEKREDLGLLIFLNSSHRSFAREVCVKVLDKHLKVIYAADEECQPNNEKVTDDEKLAYLTNLAKSKLVKPARLVISNLKEEICAIDPLLKFYLPEMDCVRDDIKRKSALSSGEIRRNKYGETGLHRILKEEEPNSFMLERQLQMFPEDINAQDNYGNTPLHDCCSKDGRAQNLYLLIDLYWQEKLQVPINFFIRNKGLETPVHLAASFSSEKHVNDLYCLIEYYKAEDVLYTPNGAGKLPFELTSNIAVRNILKPKDYDENGGGKFNGCALSPLSMTQLKNSFAIKKLLAFIHCYA